MVQWQPGILPKYLVVSTASLAGCILLRELIKRTNLTRFLFGMRSKGLARGGDEIEEAYCLAHGKGAADLQHRPHQAAVAPGSF